MIYFYSKKILLFSLSLLFLAGCSSPTWSLGKGMTRQGSESGEVKEMMYYDYVDEKGNLHGGHVPIDVPNQTSRLSQQALSNLAGTVTTLVSHGPSSNRVNMVFFG